MFQAHSTHGEYHGQMNARNFQKWIVEKWLPNIPENSVIVMDNAPYHSIQINKPPPKHATKRELHAWLGENNVLYSDTLTNFELAQVTAHHKPREKHV